MVTTEERAAIGELARALRARKVDKDSAVIISAMVRNGDRRQRLMAWMNQNPNATPEEIGDKADELHEEK